MKRLLSIAFLFSLTIIFAPQAYSGGPERIFDADKADIYEDAKAPTNQNYIDANTEALKKQGKIKEDVDSIGGITIEKGATIFGPIGTDVDMHGGNITIINEDKK
jgi:hypothetical protein